MPIKSDNAVRPRADPIVKGNQCQVMSLVIPRKNPVFADVRRKRSELFRDPKKVNSTGRAALAISFLWLRAGVIRTLRPWLTSPAARCTLRGVTMSLTVKA